MVISIIAILSVIGITIFSSAQQQAKKAKVKADFHAIYLNMEQARQLQQKVLGVITWNYCSACSCRGADISTQACLDTMTTSYSKVTSAPLPIDPWGKPYTWDENEGEQGGCSSDYIYASDGEYFQVPMSGFSGC